MEVTCNAQDRALSSVSCGSGMASEKSTVFVVTSVAFSIMALVNNHLLLLKLKTLKRRADADQARGSFRDAVDAYTEALSKAAACIPSLGNFLTQTSSVQLATQQQQQRQQRGTKSASPTTTTSPTLSAAERQIAERVGRSKGVWMSIHCHRLQDLYLHTRI